MEKSSYPSNGRRRLAQCVEEVQRRPIQYASAMGLGGGYDELCLIEWIRKKLISLLSPPGDQIRHFLDSIVCHQVAKDCAFHPQTLAIAGSTLLSGDTSLSTDAWRRLHTRLVDKAGVQTTSTLCLRGRLNPVLDVSYDEMGRRQRAHFLALAVLPSGVSVPKKMLSRLWDEVRERRGRCLFPAYQQLQY